MLKTIAAGIALSFALAGSALAQTCPAYNFTLTNGTNANADQVMDNFNRVRNCVNNSVAPLASPHFSGNLGIGTASPAYPLHVISNSYPQAHIAASSGPTSAALDLQSSANTFRLISGNDSSFAIYDLNSNAIRFGINTVGSVGVNTAPGGWSGNSTFSAYTNTTYWAGSFYSTSSAGGALLVRTDNPSLTLASFYFGPNPVGSIYSSGSSTSYNTTSDYRLKTNVEPMTGGMARLMRLQPKRFNWKAQPTAPKSEGFLAHEVQQVAPYAVTGEKDAVNPDGSIQAQQVDYSKLVPLLVAAVQEEVAAVKAQQAEIKQLHAEVAALKSGR